MNLKPFDIDEAFEGLEKEKIEETEGIFNEAGASIQTAAKTISHVMKFGETDASKLKAAELALKVHDVFRPEELTKVPILTINIIGNEQKTLVNLVMPQV